MKLPISKRLLLCAELVPACETVADVGTDHGYLGIHLLQTGRCSHVIAADLREKPLASARANAAAYGIPCVDAPRRADNLTAPEATPPRRAANLTAPEATPPCRAVNLTAPTAPASPRPTISFRLSDGLHHFEPGEFNALVLAGMGGDLITRILDEAPWLEGGDYCLVLQPQSAANELRRWLGERRWSISRERLVRDGGFLYSAMLVRPGQGSALSPGEQYISPALRREEDPLFPAYLARVRRALELTVEGISRSSDPADRQRAAYYRAALQEIQGLGMGPG